jgi:hypothetical protein
LMESLKVHQARLNRIEETDDAKTFYTKGESLRN